MSAAMERYDRYKEYNLDYILLYIKNGSIKSGKYSHLVKVSKKPIKGKEFFSNGSKVSEGSKSK